MKIKFSHHYPKIWMQKRAELIAVRILDAQAVSINQDLKEYDTMWAEPDGDMGYYPLPQEGKLIQLIFLGNSEIPFCTLRRYTPEKYEYYKNCVHNVFDLLFEVEK